MSGTFIFSINQKVKFIYSCDRKMGLYAKYQIFTIFLEKQQFCR
jgi:hypothetical protein